MVAKEYCCYTRPYSSIEGFQHAHTLYYSASVEDEGVVLELRRQQGDKTTMQRVICPVGDFGRLMDMMRYLCENGVEMEQWLDVLQDHGQVYWPCMEGKTTVSAGRFVPFAGFEGANLVHNPELTQSV